MKRYTSQIIFITGLIVFISNLIINHLRCTAVGIGIMILGFLTHQIKKTRLVLPKAFLLSIMFWIIRFSLISIPIALNFYQFVPTKIAIFIILCLFFVKNFPHHPLKFYKFHVFIVFLCTNFFLDLIITRQFDPDYFRQLFYYISLLPIFLIQAFSSNAKISYVSK